MSVNPYDPPHVEGAAPLNRRKGVAAAVTFSCISSVVVHVILWLSALACEPFQKLYYCGHLLAVFVLDAVHLAPPNPSLGFFIATLPAIAACLHTLLIAIACLAGGLLARRLALNAFAWAALAGGACAAAILLMNALFGYFWDRWR
jgi:hypothetical protein